MVMLGTALSGLHPVGVHTNSGLNIPLDGNAGDDSAEPTRMDVAGVIDGVDGRGIVCCLLSGGGSFGENGAAVGVLSGLVMILGREDGVEAGFDRVGESLTSGGARSLAPMRGGSVGGCSGVAAAFVDSSDGKGATRVVEGWARDGVGMVGVSLGLLPTPKDGMKVGAFGFKDGLGGLVAGNAFGALTIPDGGCGTFDGGNLGVASGAPKGEVAFPTVDPAKFDDPAF
jgi:hypothetical protein